VADFCRQLLASAPRNVLNLVATLVLEFPTLLAILPSVTEGFHSLVVMTLHRVRLFAGPQLPKFLEMCDRSVRVICENLDGIAKEILLLDAASNDSVTSAELANLFDVEITADSLAAFVMFARQSSCPDGTFLPLETRRKIAAALTDAADLPICTMIPPDTDPQAMSGLAELLESNKILQMARLVPSPVL
jgi:hypothetical protein